MCKNSQNYLKYKVNNIVNFSSSSVLNTSKSGNSFNLPWFHCGKRPSRLSLAVCRTAHLIYKMFYDIDSCASILENCCSFLLKTIDLSPLQFILVI